MDKESNIKQQLYKLCQEHVAATIKDIETAIAERREAIKSDTKSSMGDKYETAREMLQQDINMNLNRLSKVQADEAVLNRIKPELKTSTATEGSLVLTNNGKFYISISAGKLKIDNEIYYAVSMSSPIAQQLKGKKVGDNFTLNSKKYIIVKII